MGLRLRLVLVLLLFSCGLPRDPEGTLQRVQGGKIRIGVTENAPWVSLTGGAPSGAEVDLVEDFAEMLDAEARWFPGPEAELIAALERRELDLVIGGFTDDDAWAQMVTFTQPYATIEVLVGVPPGTAGPQDLDGVRVVARAGTEVPGLVAEAGAIPVRVEQLSADGGPVAAEEWELRALGLTPTDIVLDESNHAMAVPVGENAWLVRLERFLSSRAASVDELLGKHAQR